MQKNDTNLGDAVSAWLTLMGKLPENVVESDYFKKQKKIGMTPVSIAAYILHPHYKGKLQTAICTRVSYLYQSQLHHELFIKYFVSGENLPVAEKNEGLNWISKKSDFYLIFVGELNKSSSTYFFDAFLQPSARKNLKPIDWWANAITPAVPKPFAELVHTLFLFPASTAGIERCFSTMGNIMTRQRNRISVEKAAKLCAINNYYKLKHSVDNLKNDSVRVGKKRKLI
jgi:hypothetical protein